MPRPNVVSADAQALKVLFQAKRAVLDAQMATSPVRVDWLVGKGVVREAVNRAVLAAIRDALPPAQFKPAVLAILQAKIDTIKAQYPNLFEE